MTQYNYISNNSEGQWESVPNNNALAIVTPVGQYAQFLSRTMVVGQSNAEFIYENFALVVGVYDASAENFTMAVAQEGSTGDQGQGSTSTSSRSSSPSEVTLVRLGNASKLDVELSIIETYDKAYGQGANGLLANPLQIDLHTREVSDGVGRRRATSTSTSSSGTPSNAEKVFSASFSEIILTINTNDNAQNVIDDIPDTNFTSVTLGGGPWHMLGL